MEYVKEHQNRNLEIISGDGSGYYSEIGTTFTPQVVEQTTDIIYENTSLKDEQFPTTIFVNRTITDNMSNSLGYRYVLYIGGGISIASCLIALFTYASSRKFRVKRPHMITINLCISLIIFYAGIVIAVASTSVDGSRYEIASQSCITGATFFQLGVLYAWTWAAVHWAYLTYSVHKIAAPHISHFVIKITIPAYGFPTILTGSILIANSAWENSYVSTQTCFFRLGQPLTAVINFLYLVICFALMSACVGYCIGRLTCKDEKNHVESTRMRIKGSVTRLAVITTGVIAISILEFIRAGVVEAYSDTWFEVFNGIVLGAAGIVVSVGLTLRSKEFRLYLVKHSRSTVSVQNLVNNLSRKKRKPKQKLRSTKSNSKASKFDIVRPPKPVPRGCGGKSSISTAPNIQPSTILPGLHPAETVVKMIGVDQNGNGRTSQQRAVREHEDVENQNTSNIETQKNKVSKRAKAVSRISSLRQRVLSSSFGNPINIHDESFPLPPFPDESKHQSMQRSVCRPDDIPEGVVDRVSLCSVDMAMQSSF